MDLNQTQLIFTLALSTLGGGFLLGIYLRWRAKQALNEESRERHEQRLRYPERGSAS